MKEKLKNNEGIALTKLIIIIVTVIALIAIAITISVIIYNTKTEKGSTTATEEETYLEPEDNNSLLDIGDYVEYDVSYTDAMSRYEYTSKNGWRVLDPGVDNPDGTSTGVKIISTGVPAFLDYFAFENEEFMDEETIANQKQFIYDGKTLGKWLATEEQMNEFNNTYFNNIYSRADKGAVGLYENFEFIKFLPYSDESRNIAHYEEINGQTTGELYGNAFLVDGVGQEVHNITIKEYNKAIGRKDLLSTELGKEPANGLFYLRHLKELTIGNYQYYIITPEYDISRVAGLNAFSSDSWSSESKDYIGLCSGESYLRPVITLEPNTRVKKIN